MPKVKAKQTRALDILKKDTGILESPTPSRVFSYCLSKPVHNIWIWNVPCQISVCEGD